MSPVGSLVYAQVSPSLPSVDWQVKAETISNLGVVGVVFEDRNEDGIQQNDGANAPNPTAENGLAGVRLVSADGQVVQTDAMGRFHFNAKITSIPQQGGYWTVKIDPTTLPVGSRVLGPNPRVVKLSLASSAAVNIGVQVPRPLQIRSAQAGALEIKNQGDVPQLALAAQTAQARAVPPSPIGINDTTTQLVIPEAAQALLQQKAPHDIFGRIWASVDPLTEEVSSAETEVQSRRDLNALVTLRGYSIAEGVQIQINQEPVVLTQDRHFVRQVRLPTGVHQLDVQVQDASGTVVQSALRVEVPDTYFFMTGLAQLHLSDTQLDGAIQSLSPQDQRRFDSQTTDGRVSFFLKGKIKGRYLLTAHADTGFQQGSQLFSGLLKPNADPWRDRIDPEQDYPVYGDDSLHPYDSVQKGKLFVRLNWDSHQATWGAIRSQVPSDLAPPMLSSYDRALYGAQLMLNSDESLIKGEPQSQLQAFAAKSYAQYGRSDFIGTGGSLYFLKHTDIEQGSERVQVQQRDPISGRIKSQVTLHRDQDYTLDALQGRIELKQPLSQLLGRSQALWSTPLFAIEAGDHQVLVVQYVHRGLVGQANMDESDSAGVRAKHWLNDNLAVGVTAVKEQRSGADYQLRGADVTVRDGRGAMLTVEQSSSQGGGAETARSVDGGLSFAVRGDRQAQHLSGEAWRVLGQLDMQERGWTPRPWQLSAWHNGQDAEFASDGLSLPLTEQTETGLALIGDVSDRVRMALNHQQVRQGEGGPQPFDLSIQRMGLQWRPSAAQMWSVHWARAKKEPTTAAASSAQMVGLRWDQRLTTNWGVFAAVQHSLQTQNTPQQHAVAAGVQWADGESRSLGAQIAHVDQSTAVSAQSAYQRTQQHSLYASYTLPVAHKPHESSPWVDSLFTPQGGWVLGQQWQLNSAWRVHQESQWHHDDSGAGQLNSVGLEFTPKEGWKMGASLQKGRVGQDPWMMPWTGQDAEKTTVERESLSLSAQFTDAKWHWSSKLEHRKDHPAPVLAKTQVATDFAKFNSSSDAQTLWLSAHRLTYTLDPAWRLQAQVRMALASNKSASDVAARQDAAYLRDNHIGLAWRPLHGRWYVLGKYTQFEDLLTPSQHDQKGGLGDRAGHQKSRITSVDGNFQINNQWAVGGKLAYSDSDVQWIKPRTNDAASQVWQGHDVWLAAVQLRWQMAESNTPPRQAKISPMEATESPSNPWRWQDGWSTLLEYRVLDVASQGRKQGWLLSVDKEMGERVRFGVGYNFTDFSSDLTQLGYQHRGWFMSLMAKY